MPRAWFALALLAYLTSAYACFHFARIYEARVRAERYLYRPAYDHRLDRWTGSQELWDRAGKRWVPRE